MSKEKISKSVPSSDKSWYKFPKKEKVYFADVIKFIYDEGYDGLVKRFIFVNVIHISFETLISVYILEMVGIFTKFFLKEPEKISQIRIIVILPFVLMLSLAFFFGIWAAYYFAKNVYIYAHDYHNVEPTKTNYCIITSRFRKQIIRTQVVGCILYMISTIIIPMIFVDHYSNNIEHPLRLMIIIPILGSILGITWNITGIFRNQRLLWTQLFTTLSNDKTKYYERVYNYKYYVENAVGNIISIVEIFALFVFVLFNLHESLLQDEILKSLTTNFGFLFVYFITLVGFYIKCIVKQLYCTWNDKGIFPSMKRIMK